MTRRRLSLSLIFLSSVVAALAVWVRLGPLPEGMLALCDYVTPNESEAEALTGLPVTTHAEAEAWTDGSDEANATLIAASRARADLAVTVR